METAASALSEEDVPESLVSGVFEVQAAREMAVTADNATARSCFLFIVSSLSEWVFLP